MRNHLSPFGPARGLVFLSVKLDMTAAAVGDHTVDVVGVGTFPKGRLVVRFKRTGPAALAASVAVALEDGAAHGGPAAGIQVGVVSAQVLLFRDQFQNRPSGSLARFEMFY